MKSRHSAKIFWVQAPMPLYDDLLFKRFNYTWTIIPELANVNLTVLHFDITGYVVKESGCYASTVETEISFAGVATRPPTT